MRATLNIFCLLVLLVGWGCEDADLQLAAEAGIEAVTALTLSDEAVRELAGHSAAYADNEHAIAPENSSYGRRLRRLVKDQGQDGIRFNFKVYLDDTVNAFAMADGSIRLYSGLMDLMDDGELRFVIGHEMGHVVKEHVRHKLQMAYGVSAIRKGLAAGNNTLGDLARSQLGDFAEVLMSAQFSQMEEKIADDYGLQLLLQEGYDPRGAVTALRKLAALGAGHTFLSSHPDPGLRAERLALQIEGKALPIEDRQRSYLDAVRSFLWDLVSGLAAWLRDLPALFRGR